MEVSVEDLSPLRKSLKIVLPEKKVAKRLSAAYKKLQSTASLKGFRKGKIPQKVLEKNYGDQVKAEVGEKLIQDSYFDALEQSGLDAVVHPDVKTVSFEDDGTYSYVAEVEIKPEFELKEYKGLKVEHPRIEVSDEEIEKSMEITRKEMAPLRGVEGRGAQEEDLMIIDFQGYDEEGKAITQVVGTEYSVDLGSGRNGKEFEDMLLGLKNGEEVSRVVDFPPNIANPLLAGKKVEFKVKVKDLKERVLPEYDDEFAKDVSDDFETLDDLKKGIAAKIKAEKEKTAEGDITDKLMAVLLEDYDFELPARLVAYEIDQLIKELENNLKQQGMDLASAGLSQEQLAEQYKEAAERRVRGEFILKKIAEKEEIKVGEDDINAGFSRIAQQYNMTVDEVKQYFQSRNEMLPFMNELLSEKILKFLREAAEITYVEPAAAEDEEKTADGEE